MARIQSPGTNYTMKVRNFPTALIAFFIISLGSFASAPSEANSKGNAVFGIFLPFDVENQSLPLPVEVLHRKKLYRDSMTALRIEEVLCDGRELDQIIDEVPSFRLDQTLIEPKASIWFYLVSLKLNRLTSGMKLTLTGPKDAVSFYELPKVWQELRLCYYVEFPDGTRSANQTLYVERQGGIVTLK